MSDKTWNPDDLVQGRCYSMRMIDGSVMAGRFERRDQCPATVSTPDGYAIMNVPCLIFSGMSGALKDGREVVHDEDETSYVVVEQVVEIAESEVQIPRPQAVGFLLMPPIPGGPRRAILYDNGKWRTPNMGEPAFTLNDDFPALPFSRPLALARLRAAASRYGAVPFVVANGRASRLGDNTH